MCWSSKSKPRLRVAKKDIKVLKFLLKCDDEYVSPYRKEKYNIGEDKACDIEEPRYDEILGGYCINRGIHSYSFSQIVDRKTSLLVTVRHKSVDFTLAKMLTRIHLTLAIIPAGSMYYKNKCGEIVSDRLKIVKDVCVGTEIPIGFFGTFKKLMYLCNRNKNK